eukprot:gnl/TRDRNA2_/TRDRNA2_43487_c0_seq1.p1 gnl/TRDRNA2_/TRDRNA2_43487_c0~~gnl/TRDRNA2_/TRDRNA2_43487_c0_seq1.p1  ORF type:complete len:315 (+),score=63.95 gnl/TRDRNA2_/TRDRNA2_43487_c0_seq1:32-976(+)
MPDSGLQESFLEESVPFRVRYGRRTLALLSVVAGLSVAALVCTGGMQGSRAVPSQLAVASGTEASGCCSCPGLGASTVSPRRLGFWPFGGKKEEDKKEEPAKGGSCCGCPSKAAAAPAVKLPWGSASDAKTKTLDGKVEAGFGHRYKKLGPFPLHVYDVSFYVDKWSPLWGKKNVNADQIANAVPGKASLLIDITNKHVSNEKMASALREALVPRMPKGADKGSLDEFEKVLCSGPKVSTGSKIQIDFVSEGIAIQTNGKKLGSVKSGWISKALSNVYFDNNPVIPNLKSRVQNRLPDGHAKFTEWNPSADAHE